MLKNGRPYTNEDFPPGEADDVLVTRHSLPELVKIAEWIKGNLRHSDTEYRRSSYSLKHILEEDTGIYLTNNEFKDAMLLAGFEPVKYNEKNWRYRLTFLKEDRDVINPFIVWLEKKYDVLSGAEKDFAKSAIFDEDFPLFADHDIISSYLLEHTLLAETFNAFDELWECYKKE